MSSDKARILIQLDPDAQASIFDGVVAVDAGAQQLFRCASVTPEQVRDLVHGAIFTRGPAELKSTAIFIGGSDVTAGEKILAAVKKVFFGPMRVSVMLDANGANTTAAAAVIAAARHVSLKRSTAVVLAGTGSVGQRAARLLAREGATVRLASRSLSKAQAACEVIRKRIDGANIAPYETSDEKSLARTLAGASVAIAAGAAGAELVPPEMLENLSSLKVAVDLNAVPPAGIAGVQVMDKARTMGSAIVYGAIGVGGTKMKIHKAAIRRLFESNDQVLDAEEILAIGRELEAAK